jgi:WD40 repeat protein
VPRVSLDRGWSSDIGDFVTDLRWSSDGNWLAAAGSDGRIAVYEAGTGEAARLQGHGMGTLGLAWRPGEPVLASAGQDGMVRLWDVPSGREIACGEGGGSWVEHVAWRSDGEQLATAAGRSLRIWSPDGELVREHVAASTISGLAWHPSRDRIATSGYGGVTVWREGAARPRVLGWKGASLCIAWSPDASFIATGDQDASVHFWKLADGKDMMASGYPTKVRSLAWHRQGKLLASAAGPLIVVWNCAGRGPAGTTPRELQGHEGAIVDLCFQRHGDVLASADTDGLVVLWEPVKGKRPKPDIRARHPAELTRVVFSPDDDSLAIGDVKGGIAVLNGALR